MGKAVGQDLTAEFTPPADGTYYITVCACSAADLGTLFVDDILLVARPLTALPSKPMISGDVDDNLLVSITVTAPTTYTDGSDIDALNQPLKPGSLTYTIYMEGVAEPVAAGLTATTHTFRAVAEDTQAFCSFRVSAVNKAGEGSVSRPTEAAPYGKPDVLPYKESFSDLSFDNQWIHSVDEYSNASWSFIASSETPPASPVDADGGMLGFYGESLGESASVSSAKIYLGEGDNPHHPCLKRLHLHHTQEAQPLVFAS